MHAMLFQKPGEPLIMVQNRSFKPKPDQLLIKVTACGVCRTDLHIIDNELRKPKLPLILGHEIVGTVLEIGSETRGFSIGQRVGVPWLAQTCFKCEFCLSGRENLCDEAQFTGYNVDGGYASHTVANYKFCFPLPDTLKDEETAPLLCAGLIGWRTLKMAGDAKRIGIFGFGAAAHLIAQVAIHQGKEVYAFTRKGDEAGQDYARKLGASWAGSSDQMPPQLIDAALIFAPAGELIPLALKASNKGASIVCGGIHMSDIPSFPYSILWEERSIKSVANLTRQDAIEFLEIAAKIPVHPQVTTYKLEDANKALDDLRHGRFHGAAVLKID
ncbi:MAG: zinc-dependent alcohol dehydrogenase family protein [Candidatus Melainabacteria bacterium]|nr:zinc-dependent alcohol dehydrogenase family protein [Candidatus Melainabacteria bacterium]